MTVLSLNPHTISSQPTISPTVCVCKEIKREKNGKTSCITEEGKRMHEETTEIKKREKKRKKSFSIGLLYLTALLMTSKP